MLTRVDHVMICVPSLDQGIDAYTRIMKIGRASCRERVFGYV